MPSVTFEASTLEDVAEQARVFSDKVLGPRVIDDSPLMATQSTSIIESGPIGFRPQGVGIPKFFPIDDGAEWTKGPLADWINSLNPKGRIVVQYLARNGIVGPRESAAELGWSGSSWAGVWNNPRRQAAKVKGLHGLGSWPYGHSYEDPRRLWMHPQIAESVRRLLDGSD